MLVITNIDLNKEKNIINLVRLTTNVD